jgi:prophage regulatory protein
MESMHQQITQAPKNVLRKPAVEKKTGLSRMTIWRRVREGRFPAPFKLSDNAVGWLESDIDAWIAERAEGR